MVQARQPAQYSIVALSDRSSPVRIAGPPGQKNTGNEHMHTAGTNDDARNDQLLRAVRHTDNTAPAT
jgi:hypothetical protein